MATSTVIPDVTVDGVEVFVQPNGNVNIEVYGLLRFTVEHTPDGFACSLVADDGPVYMVTTYDTMEVRHYLDLAEED